MNQQDKYVQRQHGLYRSAYEHDACGVGMVAKLSGEASHDIVVSGLTILKRLMHRGATGNDPETGDGAGLLLKIPQGFFRKKIENCFSHKEHIDHKEHTRNKGDTNDCSVDFVAKQNAPFGIAMIFGGEGEEQVIEDAVRNNS